MWLDLPEMFAANSRSQPQGWHFSHRVGLTCFRLEMKKFFDAFFQAVQVEGLGEEVLGLHGGGAFGDVAGEGAHENNRDFLGARLASQDFADRKTVQVR